MPNKSVSRAATIALAHVGAWSKHDYELARKGLAADVKVTATSAMPGMMKADSVGIDAYMQGLTQFGQLVVPGSLQVINRAGDERNALLTLSMQVTGGPLGGAKMTLQSARLYLIDDAGKISVEQVIFYIGTE